MSVDNVRILRKGEDSNFKIAQFTYVHMMFVKLIICFRDLLFLPFVL